MKKHSSSTLVICGGHVGFIQSWKLKVSFSAHSLCSRKAAFVRTKVCAVLSKFRVSKVDCLP